MGTNRVHNGRQHHETTPLGTAVVSFVITIAVLLVLQLLLA
jgi:hypothetical protein